MTNLADALKYNPFQGDFGDLGDREFVDKIVRFRKAGPCHICGFDVRPGMLGRRLTKYWEADKVAMTYRYCTLCTEAMAASWTDEGVAFDERYRSRS
jgi:hypothetical protein